jgi:hypothetical protein
MTFFPSTYSCDALNPNRSLIRAISQQQQHAQTFQAYPPGGHFAMLPSLSPQPKNLTSVSPMIIMSKLSCHVDAILKLGADGTKLQPMLVGGDTSLCYAMGMRGLVGKEAINPWKCVGVEIPVSHVSVPKTSVLTTLAFSPRTSSRTSQNLLWERSPGIGLVHADAR